MSIIHDDVTAEILRRRWRRYNFSSEMADADYRLLAAFANEITHRLVEHEAYTHPVNFDLGVSRARSYVLEGAAHYQIENIKLAAAIVRDLLPVWPILSEEKAACAALDALISGS